MCFTLPFVIALFLYVYAVILTQRRHQKQWPIVCAAASVVRPREVSLQQVVKTPLIHERLYGIEVFVCEFNLDGFLHLLKGPRLFCVQGH